MNRMLRYTIAAATLLLAAAINFGTFFYEAGKSGDGYWTVADFGVYLVSLFVAGTIIISVVIWVSDRG